MLGILWPESDPERARHALSQALYNIRQDIGADTIRATPDQRLVLVVPSDVQDLREAIAARRWDLAAAHYVGPFLDGFYLSEAPEFERWLEEERAGLAKAGIRALELAARALAEDGRHDEAGQLWLRLTRLDPFNPRFAAAVMEGLAAGGDRVAALAHGRMHVDLVRREFDADPDRTVEALMARLRDAPTPRAEPTSPAVAQLPAPPIESDEVQVLRLASLAQDDKGVQVLRPASLAHDHAIVAAPLRAKSRWLRAAALFVGATAVVGFGWREIDARRSVSADPSRGDPLTGNALVARRLYDEGLRSLYQFDGPAASRRFRAALREDPQSAITAYRTWQAAVVSAEGDANELADSALSLAAHAPSHDSLLIVTHIGVARNDVGALAAARALAVRYPDDPEALVRAAEALSTATTELAQPVSLLERAVVLDSAAGTGERLAPCRACEALGMLVVRYEEADSLDAAERVLRRWSMMRPADPVPWWFLSGLDVTRGKNRAAQENRRRYEALGGPRVDAVERLVQSLYSDDSDAANAQCAAGLAARDAKPYTNFRWYCAIALRSQGRYRAAFDLVAGQRATAAPSRSGSPPVDPRLSAIIDLEMDQSLRAADAFRALARADNRSTSPSGIRAHGVAWHLTLAATAAVAGGDTIAARALVDTIESAGQRSLAVRGPLLHHFVRGLLYSRGGQHEAAVRELRAALQAPARGFTRINYELGKSLLALNQAAEAISVVRPALHGGIEGPELYITRTELHELLAQSFAAAGQRDSAVVHYAVVERAWRSADPAMRSRWAVARGWANGSGPAPK
ncbi:MAG: BTAD domain-containing putative transcriptional regulator [bacterium]